MATPYQMTVVIEGCGFQASVCYVLLQYIATCALALIQTCLVGYPSTEYLDKNIIDPIQIINRRSSANHHGSVRPSHI